MRDSAKAAHDRTIRAKHADVSEASARRPSSSSAQRRTNATLHTPKARWRRVEHRPASKARVADAMQAAPRQRNIPHASIDTADASNALCINKRSRPRRNAHRLKLRSARPRHTRIHLRAASRRVCLRACATKNESWRRSRPTPSRSWTQRRIEKDRSTPNATKQRQVHHEDHVGLRSGPADLRSRRRAESVALAAHHKQYA